MSVGIGRISKGLFQEAIERVANNNDTRAGLINALKDRDKPTAWFDFLEEQGALESASTDYVRNRWCKFWPAYPAETVEAIIRQSLLEALDLAKLLSDDQKSFIPIDCHWIWTNDAETLEVLITYNERQVTRILLTPPPPTSVRLSLPGLAPYFIVKPRQRVSQEQEQELPRNPEATQKTIYADAEHPINRYRARQRDTKAAQETIYADAEHPISQYRAQQRDAEAPWVTIQIKAQR